MIFFPQIVTITVAHLHPPPPSPSLSPSPAPLETPVIPSSPLFLAIAHPEAAPRFFSNVLFLKLFLSSILYLPRLPIKQLVYK